MVMRLILKIATESELKGYSERKSLDGVSI